MGVEDLDYVLLPRSEAYLGTSDTLPNIPISPPKRRRSPVQRIANHRALLDGPPGQDDEACAESATVVEFAVGEHEAGLAADGQVVLLAEELLQSDDVGLGIRGGDTAADFGYAFAAELGDVFEAPAVEGEDVDIGRKGGHWKKKNVWDVTRGYLLLIDMSYGPKWARARGEHG